MGLLGGLSPGGTITIGIFVGLLSTGVQSLGLTLQRKSHILEDEKAPHEVHRPPYRRARWQLGMGMFIAANILGSTVQISTLPLPVLSTLQASGLVFNSICATLVLAEPFTRWSLCGTGLVCTGAVLIAVFGAIPTPAHDLRELLELLSRRPFVVWMILQGLFVVAVAVVTDSLKVLPKLKQNPTFRFARGLAYGCISGTLSAHTLLVAKSAVELIIKTFSGSTNQFVHWQAWVLVLTLITLALTQLYYLHRGLKLVSTSVLYPLVFCVYNIIAILDGLIYFNQTSLLGALRGGLIALGTVILLSGVLALSWRLSDEQHTPGVGQSSLAPGLGLVEDTEGEEESLLESDSLEEGNALVGSYSTFKPAENGEGTPLTPTMKPNGIFRWQERAQIWDELQDQDAPSSPFARHRSSTLPASEITTLLPTRHVSSGAIPHATETAGPASAATTENSLLRPGRRRRKSTGFPGFTARRNRRRSQASLQDALGGIWKMNWWRSRHGRERPSSGDVESEAGMSPAPGPAHRPIPGEDEVRRGDGDHQGDQPLAK
ncbi:DUF803 domain protein [Sodiomyces alkalinus F11]|uniref:DUF803 domain protein n=1 Tax=Sodiomyces alkalinus (strain CBS 110278 / VKM F-3762 / F11) TaxID=1314773 RepID=A0A3N2PSR5_SODAK|nr:DUF803 domain protein [Sodiomyces alkalinus F11]ROT37547.1 DUF803 domain protein [Sodiomyces alkalinus F11]